MKVRNGFVSNSSSSSFVCDYCHNASEIYDGDSEIDYGYITCENGHSLCISHLDSALQARVENKSYWSDSNQDNEEDDDEDDEYDDGEYQLKEADCPLCQLTLVTDDNIVKYLSKVLGKTPEKITEEMKEHFKNLDGLKTFLQTKNATLPSKGPEPGSNTDRSIDLD